MNFDKAFEIDRNYLESRRCCCQAYKGGMTSRAQELLSEALKLPLDERAGVAAELLASLDDADMSEPTKSRPRGPRRSSRGLAVFSPVSPLARPWEDVRRRAEEKLRRR